MDKVEGLEILVTVGPVSQRVPLVRKKGHIYYVTKIVYIEAECHFITDWPLYKESIFPLYLKTQQIFYQQR